MMALGESCGWSTRNLSRVESERDTFCTQHGITEVRNAVPACTSADGQQRGQRHPCGEACVGMQTGGHAWLCARRRSVRSSACLLGPAD